jgi:hypothetical protein
VQITNYTFHCHVLQYLNDNVANVVLMEDRSASVFVAIGEYNSLDYSPDRFDCSSYRNGRLIHVVLTACTQPEFILPYLVLDDNGKVLC